MAKTDAMSRSTISFEIPELAALCQKIRDARASESKTPDRCSDSIGPTTHTVGFIRVEVFGLTRVKLPCKDKPQEESVVLGTGVVTLTYTQNNTTYTYCGDWTDGTITIHAMSSGKGNNITDGYITIDNQKLEAKLDDCIVSKNNHLLVPCGAKILVPLRPDQILAIASPDGHGFRVGGGPAGLMLGGFYVGSISKEIYARDPLHHEVVVGDIYVDSLDSSITWSHANSDMGEFAISKITIPSRIVLDWITSGTEPNIFEALDIVVPRYDPATGRE